jgi:hypothetical protein
MKLLNTILISIIVSFSSVSFAETTSKKEEPKTKTVCRKERDRNGQEKEVCKTIKVHKKLEGTKVPTK